MDKQLEISKELQPFFDRTESLAITDRPSLNKAVSLLSKLNQMNDSIQKEKEKVTKPLNNALKAERARWKPTEMALQGLITDIRYRMTTYQTEQLRIQKLKEDSIARRVGPGKGNLSLETAVKQMESLPKAEKEVETDYGSVQFREKKQLKITDPVLIPYRFHIIDEEALLEALLQGEIITGAEIETIQIPYNMRK